MRCLKCGASQSVITQKVMVDHEHFKGSIHLVQCHRTSKIIRGILVKILQH